MKKIIQSAIVLGLLCGYASAIGIEWGVEELYLPGPPVALASSTTYGTGLGDYVLRLVWVGDASMSLVNGVNQYDDFTVVDSGSLMTIPFEQPGAVGGSTTITDDGMAGTYVMLLYNNYGGYYALSQDSSFSVIADQINDPMAFPLTQNIDGPVYRGALVPEPGTTALALAGIALLFRRRKA